MHDVAVPSFLAGLSAINSLLTKAEAYASENSIKPAALLECRLAADMFSFTDQLQAATDTVRRGMERLSEQEITSKEDPEPNFAALKERVQETIEAVQATDTEALNASADRKFEVAYTPEMKVPYTGKTFLLSFVLPNFYFHVTTAYNILRERGLPLGKMDYLGPLGAAYKVM